MDKVKKILWGSALIVFGILLALDVLDIIGFSVFFRGWWTLFIIVPCAIGLITESNKIGNIIGLLIGVALLLAARDLITYTMIFKLSIPVIIVIIGIKLIFKSLVFKEAREFAEKMSECGECQQEFCAAFSSLKPEISGLPFKGANINAVFGGVELDLREALIDEDVVIKASAIFGGVDIILPDDINVKVSSSSVFGGVSNKRRGKKNADSPTVYVSAACAFGGVDIK